MSFAGGRNTKYAYPRGMSRGTFESTFAVADSNAPVIEYDWGYGVASVNFPGRYYTVRKVGDKWCGSCRDERIRPLHVKAVLDFIAAKESAVTEEVTADVIETAYGTHISAGTRIYRVDGQVLFRDELFDDWFCTCQETASGVHYGCKHSALLAA